jgi:hypothetical protein
MLNSDAIGTDAIDATGVSGTIGWFVFRYLTLYGYLDILRRKSKDWRLHPNLLFWFVWCCRSH